MGSLFEELEAREVAARVRVEELEAELAELSGKLELAREGLERLRIARETVAEVLAEMSPEKSVAGVDAGLASVDELMTSAYAGAERQVIGVLTVPNWQPGIGPEMLPRVYRDIVEVVSDAPGPVRAKQVVPRIGLPAETGKIEGTRAKLKRLVERGWLDEDTPGMFTPARRHRTISPNAR
ncbi:hypothetical protein ABZ642_16385 [Streptomyces sp. NPDC007157]|uniref:hypothetical protein n=1 Tax=Streptomyces sp. NPDC007157 TaxID=3154681 RepID=UPI0034019CBE